MLNRFDHEAKTFVTAAEAEGGGARMRARHGEASSLRRSNPD